MQPNGGSIKQPPVRIDSPLMFDMIQRLVDCSKIKVSQTQKDKIVESPNANPEVAQAKAVEYRELDKKLNDDTIR